MKCNDLGRWGLYIVTMASYELALWIGHWAKINVDNLNCNLAEYI
jgi:hypothetical protein